MGKIRYMVFTCIMCPHVALSVGTTAGIIAKRNASLHGRGELYCCNSFEKKRRSYNMPRGCLAVVKLSIINNLVLSETLDTYLNKNGKVFYIQPE